MQSWHLSAAHVSRVQSISVHPSPTQLPISQQEDSGQLQGHLLLGIQEWESTLHWSSNSSEVRQHPEDRKEVVRNEVILCELVSKVKTVILIV